VQPVGFIIRNLSRCMVT